MPEAAQDPRIDELLAGLNPPQRDAVIHGEGPLLILAGAGSGKTRVLTHRIAYLMRTKQARADEILAITFTNKAAQEMRERVELLVGRATRAMWVMTFHSACARMLRADAHRLGYTRQFTIYDAADQRRLIKRCLDDLDVDAKRFTPRAMQAQISDAKNKLRSSEDYRQLVDSYFEQTVADVYEQYERELHRMNAMDFDDLLVRSVNLLELFQEVRDRYSQAFRWILVDEYQDTNHAQYRWLQLLASEHRNLAVVGDDDQSVYGFRGADIKNILSFQDDFVDAHVVKLEQNYRSTQTILSAANAVVANNRGRMAKALWTDIGEGDPIKVRELSDEHAEARYVAAEIERMVDEGVSREEIAVFYRTNAQSRVLEDMLVRAQIGYQVIGGTKFYERAEIRDAVAYLTFLANPQDAGAFTRVANSPKRGLGQTSLSRVLSHADTMGITVWDAAGAPGHRPRARDRGAEGARALHVDDGAPARADGERRAGRRPARRAAARDRLLRRARRPSGRSRRRAGSRTSRSSCASRASTTRWPSSRRVGEFLQQIALIADVDSLQRRGGARDADDPPQRQGPRVPDRVHDRHGGRRLPARARARRGRDRGGAAARLRRPDARDARPHAHVRAPPHLVRGRTRSACAARFIDEIPRELTDQEDKQAVGAGWAPGRVASWSNAAAATAEASPDTAGSVFRIGDDVIHAAFGEGVVTATEPGGIVVVRFAGDGSERKLMADYAPIKKR